jgi:hypothetical protein
MNSNCRSYPVFAQELLDLAQARNPSNGWITPRVLAEHSSNRKAYSVSTNPNYFSPAYAGVAFTFGAHMFAFQMLANHSAEYPRGYLTPEAFMDWFGYTRENGQLVFTYGTEKIPDNYYKRADDDAWTLTDIVVSTAQQCASYPSNCQVGGNTGQVNSFSGVNVGDITGGLVNSVQDLSDPRRMGCFIGQAIQADVPSFLDNAFNGVLLSQVMALIPTVLNPVLTTLTANLGGCPNLPAGKSVLQYGAKYPGAKPMFEGPRSGKRSLGDEM